MLHGFQGISELFDLKAFWGSLCSWLSTSLHALWCSPAWGAFEASREKHVPGNGAWREESSRVALRTGLWRLEATVLRQILAMRGQRHVWLSLARFCSVLEQQRETRAPLAPCRRKTRAWVSGIDSLFCVTRASLGSVLACGNRDLDIRMTRYLGWAMGQ